MEFAGADEGAVDQYAMCLARAVLHREMPVLGPARVHVAMFTPVEQESLDQRPLEFIRAVDNCREPLQALLARNGQSLVTWHFWWLIHRSLEPR